MDAGRLDQLRKLAQEATPGPWEVGDHPSKVVAPCPCCGPVATCDQYGPSEEASGYNSEYIAAANPVTMLALLAEIERLRRHVRIDEEIIAKLPKTADGVVWITGEDTELWHPNEVGTYDDVEYIEDVGWRVLWYLHDKTTGGTTCHEYALSDCCSTRKAAEARRK